MSAAAATPVDLLAVRWLGGTDGVLRLIDQTLLPGELLHHDCKDPETTWEAIKMLRVRGAPAIGIAASFGVVLGMQRYAGSDAKLLREEIKRTADYLRTSRPTAVNLFWALDRMERRADELLAGGAPAVRDGLLTEAQAILDEDRQMCQKIGQYGAELIKNGSGVLTHCNAGALATADYGTALSVLFHAHAAGKNIQAFVDETRPLLQGSRLTAWELIRRGVPATLLCDNMAGFVMKQGKVQAAVVGADRIAGNGDTANKIGTYSVACLAKAHGIPFYVAAPSSTFDFNLTSGEQIPIEERDPKEVTQGMGKQTAPDGVKVYNPAFDVTPAELIAAFITERGVIRAPYVENLARILKR